jgi:hypothetical protein
MHAHKLPILGLASLLALLFFHGESPPDPGPAVPRYIGIHPENRGYFAFSDGEVYIPVGINLINPSGRYQQHADSAFMEIEQWMKNLSENGGNYIRIWLSQSFWDIEDAAGKYNEEKARRIDRFIEMARTYQLRIKVTFEHFRSITLEENPQRWATKFAYHTSQGGPLDSIRQYLVTREGQDLFLNKIDYYQNRYGSDTLFFGLELWNEMNAMKGPEDSLFFAWNKKMLMEVKHRFPHHLVMQSLGSFDSENVRQIYQKMMLLPENEVAQVHRYLDPGAPMDICQAPMDIICASAIEEILSYQPDKPVILAETGAVEPRHTGPSKYYPLDTAGILLHDILFAPFFAGSAGAGMSWHWESYVHKNNLWYHFARFREAIEDIDPVSENFKPRMMENDSLRMYVLQGKNTNLIWIRDKINTWETELEQGIHPRILYRQSIDVAQLGLVRSIGKIKAYDPWKNTWTDIETAKSVVELPEFSRSIVLRMN